MHGQRILRPFPFRLQDNVVKVGGPDIYLEKKYDTEAFNTAVAPPFVRMRVDCKLLRGSQVGFCQVAE